MTTAQPLSMATQPLAADSKTPASALEKAYEERDAELAWARVVWDGLRSEPRFIDLMRRLGFS